ncbi:MAG: hypothetical protein ACP5O5_06190 [Fervidicoccaceae archaeon]
MDAGIAVTLAALGASAASYLAARIGFSRLAEGLGIEPTPLFGMVSILLAAVIFLGVETLAYNVYALFFLMVLFLAFALAGLLIALRHVEQDLVLESNSKNLLYHSFGIILVHRLKQVLINTV